MGRCWQGISLFGKNSQVGEMVWVLEEPVMKWIVKWEVLLTADKCDSVCPVYLWEDTPSAPPLSLVLTISFPTSSPMCLAWRESKLGPMVTARLYLEGGVGRRLLGLEVTFLLVFLVELGKKIGSLRSLSFGESWEAAVATRVRNYPHMLPSDSAHTVPTESEWEDSFLRGCCRDPSEDL